MCIATLVSVAGHRRTAFGAFGLIALIVDLFAALFFVHAGVEGCCASVCIFIGLDRPVRGVPRRRTRPHHLALAPRTAPANNHVIAN